MIPHIKVPTTLIATYVGEDGKKQLYVKKFWPEISNGAAKKAATMIMREMAGKCLKNVSTYLYFQRFAKEAYDCPYLP